MKITGRRLMEADNALTKVLGTAIDFKLAYRIRKIAGKIMVEYKEIEKARQELFKKYGEKNEKGGLTVPPKNEEAFRKDFDAILAIEINIDAQKIPFDCLEGIKISPYELAVIEEFIEPEKEKEVRRPPQA